MSARGIQAVREFKTFKNVERLHRTCERIEADVLTYVSSGTKGVVEVQRAINVALIEVVRNMPQLA